MKKFAAMGFKKLCALTEFPPKVRRSVFFLFAVSMITFGASQSLFAQTYWPPEHFPPYNGANPRPDLLPRGLYDAWVPYRKAYNRPTYLGGLAAHVIEPTSQEAMSWKENHDRGYYKTHCPTPIRHYYYPKPWEVLNVGVRPSGESSESKFGPDSSDTEVVP